MNVFTVKKVLLSAAIASLISVPVLAQTSRIDGSFSNATESQSQISTAGSKTAAQSNSQADGHVAVTADGSAAKNRGQALASEGYRTSASAAQGTAARIAETNSTAQNRLASNKSSGIELHASSESRSSANAITTIETGDGVQLDLSSASQTSVTAATSIESQASGATRGLAKAAVSNAAKASGAVRSAISTSSNAARDLRQNAGGVISADVNVAAEVGADMISTIGSVEVLSESVLDMSADVQDAVTSLGADIREVSSFDLEGTGLHDSITGEISGQMDGSAGLTGGLGL